MTTMELERHTGGALAISSGQTDWTPTQRAALAQIGVDEAPPGDQLVFLHQAQRTQLDPFTRQIYMIGRREKNQRTGDWDTKWTIQTGIDGFRVIADRNPLYGGQVGPEWCGEDGVWRDVWVSQKPPVAARVGVIRKDWDRPIYAVALFREYCGRTGKGDLTRMWREKGALMVAKCAEALALRKAFPHDLSGVYTAEEMTQADQAAGAQPAPQQANNGHARAAAEPEPAAQTEPDWDVAILQAEQTGDLDMLRHLWTQARKYRPADLELRERIQQASRRVKEAQQAATPAEAEPVDAEVVDEPLPVSKRQHAHMHALWAKAELTDRGDRLALTSLLVGRRIASSSELTETEADVVIDALSGADRGTGALYQQVSAWLDEARQTQPAQEVPDAH